MTMQLADVRDIHHSLVLVQPRNTCPCLTERLLMGRKESNQTNKNWLMHLAWTDALNAFGAPGLKGPICVTISLILTHRPFFSIPYFRVSWNFTRSFYMDSALIARSSVYNNSQQFLDVLSNHRTVCVNSIERASYTPMKSRTLRTEPLLTSTSTHSFSLPQFHTLSFISCPCYWNVQVTTASDLNLFRVPALPMYKLSMLLSCLLFGELPSRLCCR